MLRKILTASTVLSLVILWAMLVATSPSTIGPLGILLFFTLMYVSALGVLTFLLYFASAVMARFKGSLKRKASTTVPLGFRECYYYASVVALAPVMLVAMQSVNEVGVYQFSLVILFVIIAWIYISKRTK